MAQLDTTVWLRPARPAASTAASGCGRCVSSGTGPVCVGAYGAPCDHPALSGEPAVLQRVLQALRGVADDDGNLVDGRRFSALHITDDEAELTLAFAAGCGPARGLAEGAFQALRAALPDTDVYVRHA